MFCDVVSVSLCEVVSDVLDVSDEVSDGVSVADVVSVSLDVSVLSVAFGVDFTSLPSEVTVLVVPSGEVTVEVVFVPEVTLVPFDRLSFRKLYY